MYKFKETMKAHTTGIIMNESIEEFKKKWMSKKNVTQNQPIDKKNKLASNIHLENNTNVQQLRDKINEPKTHKYI